MFFGENADWRGLLTGGSLMLLALLLNERCQPRPPLSDDLAG